MSEEEQFNQAFGEHTGLCHEVRDYINGIKNNQPNVINELKMGSSIAEKFNDLAWKLLGRYIANNTHLEKVDLIQCGITDEKMTLLFGELTHSTSLTHLNLSDNSFGIDGLRHMVPFLQNSPNLSRLQFGRFDIFRIRRNINFDSDCFELVVQTLHGRPPEGESLIGLIIGSCNITDISALDRYTLTNLRSLQLNNNEIGNDGCRTLSNMLQQEGSNLECLNLDNTGINDEGVTLIATSLKHNTKLNALSLQRNNNIKEGGHLVFLKLLIGVSSIKNTFNSNNTLESLNLGQVPNSTKEHVQSGIQIRSAFINQL